MGEKIFCQSGGCTAKLGAGVLKGILGKLPAFSDPSLLVGFAENDDAAVYKVTEELSLISTVDFFPPMLEDPFLFGQIAAANAMSDVYAMGGDVKLALNLLSYPEEEDLNFLGEILRGGCEKVREAGAVLAGGHSLSEQSIKYGLCVTGLAETQKILRNHTVCDGDALILTKPLGVGIVLAARSVGEAEEASVKEVIRSMCTLNKTAAEIGREFRLHASTDVTGFGLLGHLLEMLGEDFSAEIYVRELPVFTEVLHYADELYVTGSGQKNRNAFMKDISFVNVSPAWEEVLFDPQTSGGLLLSMEESEAEGMLEKLWAKGISAKKIGRVERKNKGKKIFVR